MGLTEEESGHKSPQEELVREEQGKRQLPVEQHPTTPVQAWRAQKCRSGGAQSAHQAGRGARGAPSSPFPICPVSAGGTSG
eukprot:813800-Prorocentrum_lima.AAC.1